jgi:hypothetical protein
VKAIPMMPSNEVLLTKMLTKLVSIFSDDKGRHSREIPSNSSVTNAINVQQLEIN